MEKRQILETLKQAKIIPVIVLKELSDTVPTLSAMSAGGVNVAEITFRTPCAQDAIKLAKEKFPGITVGAGTVINAVQAEKAHAAGAKFIVSPGLSADVAEYCRANGIVYFPGCVTPTEIMQAIGLGLEVIKFFPANIYGGLSAIKALSAPFPQVSFIPTGGVDERNLAEFLRCDKIFAVGGSFMVKGNTEEITEKCKSVIKIVKECMQ